MTGVRRSCYSPNALGSSSLGTVVLYVILGSFSTIEAQRNVVVRVESVCLLGTGILMSPESLLHRMCEVLPTLYSCHNIRTSR